ncbi:hypothetical protein EPA93_12180 [Ktedonosporobacter rubrisoli]|uniref:Uncharacterized protein n=1 Tax=Ktedonosporobacter rubrisoli TaxID=2509675 RepID=A0A4P6JNN2_KTERU|nr:hypothetical protein [Ktedonosporobacter rubrisoli]QBD76720.1 hypothetical protein EPA93_12180 [Ktedonosporobacter rubrisoli]
MSKGKQLRYTVKAGDATIYTGTEREAALDALQKAMKAPEYEYKKVVYSVNRTPVVTIWPRRKIEGSQ